VPCDESGDSELLLQLQQDGWKNYIGLCRVEAQTVVGNVFGKN